MDRLTGLHSIRRNNWVPTFAKARKAHWFRSGNAANTGEKTHPQANLRTRLLFCSATTTFLISSNATVYVQSTATTGNQSIQLNSANRLRMRCQILRESSAIRVRITAHQQTVSEFL